MKIIKVYWSIKELDKVKFSLSDQYLCHYNSFSNIGYSIFLIEESKNKKLAFKLTKHLFINYNQFFTFLRNWICNIQSSRTTCYRSSIFLKIITQVNRMFRSRRVLAIGGKHCDYGWTGSVCIRVYAL